MNYCSQIENIKKFLKYQIENYKIDNNIELTYGKIIDDNLFNMKVKDPLSLVKNFRNYKLRYSQGKMYFHNNLRFQTYNNKNCENRKIELLEKEMIKGLEKDILITNNLIKENTIFPNKLEYDNEYFYEEILAYIDKNIILRFHKNKDFYNIKINIFLEKDLPYTYQDDILKKIEEIDKQLRNLKC